MNVRFGAVEKRILVMAACMLAMTVFPDLAIAQDGNAKDRLPFETNVQMLATSMTGPIPMILSIVGIIGCGGMLIFGGEISGFTRTMVFLVLVISVIVQSGAIVTALGGTGLNLSLITWAIG